MLLGSLFILMLLMYVINIKQKMNKFKVKFSKRYHKKKHQLSKKKVSYLSKKKKILKGGAPGVNMMKLVESDTLHYIRSQLQSNVHFSVNREDITNLQEVFTQELFDELNEKSTSELIEYRNGNSAFFIDYPVISIVISRAVSRCNKTFKDIFNNIDTFLKTKLLISSSTCTLGTLFDAPWFPGKCRIPDEYKGTCGYPTLETVYHEYPEDYIDKIYQLLTVISERLEPGKSIGIILGALEDHEFKYTYDINLYFNRCEGGWRSKNCETFKNIDTILTEIHSGSQLNTDYRIDIYFPLTTHPTHRKLLDFILDLTDKFQIYLVNSMCGTCFGSFYYLKKRARKNFMYITGLGHSQRDTANCYMDPYNNM